MSVGSLFRNHKIIGAIGGYFVISYGIQIISSVAMLLFSRTAIIDYVDYSLNIDSVDNAFAILETGFGFYNNIMLVSCVISVIFTVVFYFVSNYILSKKLNLD